MIDIDAVTDWMIEHADSVEPPLSFDLITGGASNLTYRVTDAKGSKWVLRRPPTGHVLASAHDMGREHRIIAALADTNIAVAPLVGLEPGDEVNGAPFYVMGFVAGTIVRDRAAGDAVPLDLRGIMTTSLTDTLVDLHDIDPAAIGLGDLGRTEDYCARQLRRWKRQVDEGSDREIPLLQDLHRRLEATIPAQQGAGIVHGDYRLDNCMMANDGSVAAVLDWELCTLGDVLADLAGMVMWWGNDTSGFSRLADVPTMAAGFGTADEMVEIYAARSRRDLSKLNWYVAFQYWRLACISEGARVRFAAGAMGDQTGSDARFARQGIDALLEAADQQLRA